MDDRSDYQPLPIPRDVLQAARALRHNLTDAEHFLWYFLRRNQLGGFHFRRQHPLGPFKLDFYCSAGHLCVELDGGQHSDTVAEDAGRTAFLERQGIAVLRVWNHELFENTEGVLQTIHDAVMARVEARRESSQDTGSAPPP